MKTILKNQDFNLELRFLALNRLLRTKRLDFKQKILNLARFFAVCMLFILNPMSTNTSLQILTLGVERSSRYDFLIDFGLLNTKIILKNFSAVPFLRYDFLKFFSEMLKFPLHFILLFITPLTDCPLTDL